MTPKTRVKFDFPMNLGPTLNPHATPATGAIPGANGVSITQFPAAPAPAAELFPWERAPARYTIADLDHAHDTLVIWREETTRLLRALGSARDPATRQALETVNARLLQEAQNISKLLLNIQISLTFH